ncbi:uncharacterized protein V2V93DRAFT_368390 [Kockiozyma suomiensis]|uniref:uncharacterized protein n=1 Tax=Kockiozyma suomiensis TaxID=1337062 RepID=UPI0033437F9D
MTTNIWLAAADNNIHAVEALLLTGTHTANDKDPHGYTALHAAASYTHIKLLRLLIERGGDVDIRDEDGETPLFVVEKVEAAKVLVEELGADWQVRNTEGETAREKMEREIEEDGEPYEDIVAYLKLLEEGGKAENDMLANIQKELETIPEGMSVSIQRVPEEAEDEAASERRRRIEEALQSDNPEEGVSKLVEEAVRLQLGEQREESEPAAKRREH